MPVFMDANHVFARTVLLLSGILLLAGCAMTPYLPGESRLRIYRAVEIPSGKARAYFQLGEQVDPRAIDTAITFCGLSMRKRHVRGQPMLSVARGEFEITDVKRSSEQLFFPGTVVASLDNMYYPPTFAYRVEMLLNSSEQPGVRALICEKQVEIVAGYYASATDYPTLAEVAAALGGVAGIETP